jgi:uncharacterized membrane protein
MTVLFMLIGALFGAWICADVFDESTGATGAFFGLIAGILIGQIRTLRARIAKLEQAQSSIAAAPQTITPVLIPVQTQSAIPTAPVAARVATPTVVEPTAAAPTERPHLPAPTPKPPLPPTPSKPPEPAPEGIVYVILKRWFTQGNVPVKIGVLVLFLGVAALLKYAADEGWLRVPVEFRLAGIAAVALAGLVFAWRKRESHRSFALSLQGGAIGVLILTIFAAFRLYNFLPPGLAFALLVVVVAGTGVLAVLQDSLALAVLGIVGGFLAPILVSTSSGNHVALFSYYAILNAAIFVIAWMRPWRLLNLIGFAFTFVIGTAWGALKYKPELFATTEPFLLLFFAFYLFIPIFYARKLAPDRRDMIDASLVFGTPLICFLLQAGLLYPDKMPLAFSAVGAAAIYALLAAVELRRLGFKLLGESHALLALGFATIAVPLALSAQTTACTWAIEGAALVWLGLRQQRRLPRWIGYGLQAFAGLAFASQFHGLNGATPILNGDFLGGLLIALAGLTSARLLDRARKDSPLSLALFAWGLSWWLLIFGNEIERLRLSIAHVDWWIVFIAFTGGVGSELYRRLSWNACRYPAAAMFALAPALVFVGISDAHGGPLGSWGALAWIFWICAALRALMNFNSPDGRLATIFHFVFLWTIALLLGVELGYDADRKFALAEIWCVLAALLPFAAVFWLTLRRNAIVRWPLGARAEILRWPLLASIAVLLGIAWFLGLLHEGRPSPLPYVPLINPLELAQLGLFALTLVWYRQAEAEGIALVGVELRTRVLAVGAVLLLTAITLRSVHFLGGVPWSDALWESPLAQAALSITWTLAGIAAMLLGKRRGSRAIWIGGATLMGVVLIKLLLIDRRFLHDLPAIVGVLVVGVLLIGVGYFAPAPPRTMTEKQS